MIAVVDTFFVFGSVNYISLLAKMPNETAAKKNFHTSTKEKDDFTPIQKHKNKHKHKHKNTKKKKENVFLCRGSTPVCTLSLSVKVKVNANFKEKHQRLIYVDIQLQNIFVLIYFWCV